MKLKIALAQLDIDHPNIEDDIRAAEQFVSKAAKKGADLIIFPEYTLSNDPRRPDVDLDETSRETSKNLKKFRQLAIDHKIDIVSGSGIEKVKGKYYNTTHYIDRKGVILGRYRKINLFHPERAVLERGSKPTVIKTRFGFIGMTICWDLMSPELFREKIKRDAEIVVCPSYWPFEDATKYALKYNKKADLVLIDSLCAARAIENNIIFVFVNAASKSLDGHTLIGHSQVTIPFKGAIGKLNHNRSRLLIQEVDTSILTDGEKAYKVRSDLGFLKKSRAKTNKR